MLFVDSIHCVINELNAYHVALCRMCNFAVARHHGGPTSLTTLSEDLVLLWPSIMPLPFVSPIFGNKRSAMNVGFQCFRQFRK